MTQQSNNPFQAPSAQAKHSGAMVDVESQRAIQEVQAAMVIAKKFPRNQVEAMDRILQAFTRPTLAEGAMYSYSKGGSDVTGPSIRSAEAIAQMWGNMQFGIRELEQRRGESTVEAFAWDIESNTRQVKVFQVPHVRHTRSGSYDLKDPREIYELVANQGARRLRACVLGVIPGDVVEAAMRQAEVTLTTHADTSPEAVKRMLEAFKEFGVTSGMIEKRIQRRLQSITPALIVQMKKIYSSLRDGMSAPSDWFDMEIKDGATSVSDIVNKRGKDSSPAPEGKESSKVKAVDKAGESIDFAAKVREAGSEDEVRDWQEAARDALNEKAQAELAEIAEARIQELSGTGDAPSAAGLFSR